MRATGLGQSLEGIKAIGSLAGGALVIWVVYQIGGQLLSDASAQAPGGYGGAQANAWLNTGLDQILPAAFLALVFFGLVARAVLSQGAVR